MMPIPESMKASHARFKRRLAEAPQEVRDYALAGARWAMTTDGRKPWAGHDDRLDAALQALHKD